MHTKEKQLKINKAVDDALSDIFSDLPDLRGIGDHKGEGEYVTQLSESYMRTVNDICNLYEDKKLLENVSILELGAFLGVVSKAFKNLAADIVACDIPEFFNRDEVKSYYKRLNVPIQSFNLRQSVLPFASESKDCILLCETLEHLNFNPLPVLAEFNRILKKGGYLYVSMPDGSCFSKRLKFLFFGKSPGFKTNELFGALDPDENMVVGLHWKEYSIKETIEMITPLGFELVSSKSIYELSNSPTNVFGKLRRLILPNDKTQVCTFKKTENYISNFVVCEDA